MRRKDKEIKDKQALMDILEKADVCRIGLCIDQQPYVVPMNFAYKENSIFLHTADEGKKLDIIERNNNVCFEADEPGAMVKSDIACKWTMKYRSIIGFGKAYIIDDIKEKEEALNIIMEKYSGTDKFTYSEQSLKHVTIIRIDIDELTGKEAV